MEFLLCYVVVECCEILIISKDCSIIRLMSKMDKIMQISKFYCYWSYCWESSITKATIKQIIYNLLITTIFAIAVMVIAMVFFIICGYLLNDGNIGLKIVFVMIE